MEKERGGRGLSCERSLVAGKVVAVKEEDDGGGS